MKSLSCCAFLLRLMKSWTESVAEEKILSVINYSVLPLPSGDGLCHQIWMAPLTVSLVKEGRVIQSQSQEEASKWTFFLIFMTAAWISPLLPIKWTSFLKVFSVIQTSLLCNILGKNLRLLPKYIEKRCYSSLKNVECSQLPALLWHASTLDEMISLMDYKVLKLEDATSSLLPAGKTQSTSPLFLSDSRSEATPSLYTPLFFSYP